MRNFILFILAIYLFTSCTTRKYGCGLSKTETFPSIPVSSFRGNGLVEYYDSFRTEKLVIMRININGVLIKNDTDIYPTKYIYVCGKLADNLYKNYLGKNIRFEGKTYLPNNNGLEIYLVGGKVDGIIETCD